MARFLRPCGRSTVLPHGWSGSAEAPGHVPGRLLLGGVVEDLSGLAVLDQASAVEEHGPVGDPARLRQVVRDDDDAQRWHQRADQGLDGLGGARVK